MAAEQVEENPSDDVSRWWMYGALTGLALLAFQAYWWNKKAPQVLKLGEAKGAAGY